MTASNQNFIAILADIYTFSNMIYSLSFICKKSNIFYFKGARGDGEKKAAQRNDGEPDGGQEEENQQVYRA